MADPAQLAQEELRVGVEAQAGAVEVVAQLGGLVVVDQAQLVGELGAGGPGEGEEERPAEAARAYR